MFRFGDEPYYQGDPCFLDTIGMFHKRKYKSDDNILVPHKPSNKEMLDMLLILKGGWLNTSNISFKEFYNHCG